MNITKEGNYIWFETDAALVLVREGVNVTGGKPMIRGDLPAICAYLGTYLAERAERGLSFEEAHVNAVKQFQTQANSGLVIAKELPGGSDLMTRLLAKGGA